MAATIVLDLYQIMNKNKSIYYISMASDIQIVLMVLFSIFEFFREGYLLIGGDLFFFVEDSLTTNFF